MKSRKLSLFLVFLGKIVRDAFPPTAGLDMTKIAIAAFIIGSLFLREANAQDAPTASPAPSTSPARSVRISFLPPPLEGTISLGIYDANEQLVRVLHQEAELDEFVVGADALVTKWDGKNDDGEDLPAGKYSAHGYLVGNLKIENLGGAASFPADANATGRVAVKLMPNPLANRTNAIVDLAPGFDDENCYLKTPDGLPLFTISDKKNLVRASITRSGDRAVDVFLDDGESLEQLHVSNVDKMMAFDCGDFELK
jgi:hypothetical protein